MTQDAVRPGERYVYRFRAEQVGTFWYHTHQASSKEVRRGLFGALVIEPAQRSRGSTSIASLVAHTFDGIPTLDANDGVERLDVPPGRASACGWSTRTTRRAASPSRERRFEVVAIDGTDLNEPDELRDTLLEVAGRRPRRRRLHDARSRRSGSRSSTPTPRLRSTPARRPPRSCRPELPVFDPATYGEPAATPFDASSAFDRRFELAIAESRASSTAGPGMQWAINGRIFPDVPTFVVEEGDLVEIDDRRTTRTRITRCTCTATTCSC